MRLPLLLFLALCYSLRVFSGEGLWIPLLVDSLNYSDMLRNGLKIGPEEIYSTSNPSIKDAVVIFGGGCTGELISPNGLLVTNYHCGYSRIQAHSTVENDYLMNGFWAGAPSGELPDPGLTVTFLVRMEDVTESILKDIPDSLTEMERNIQIGKKASVLEKEAVTGTHYTAEINPFYFGNKYYLFVYEVFRDIRLVGAPPEAIGRFGGDTDNWVWPRHTGDFSLFRIYADTNNLPADYSPENVPYKPRKYLNISVGGIHEGDFTMVMGYPGQTDEYTTSDALRMTVQKTLPVKIEMRDQRLKTLEEEMSKGHESRLRYASRYVNISNAWKKWIGVTKGIERADALLKKEQLEARFDKWAGNLPVDTPGYSSLMKEFRDLYTLYEPLYISNDLGNELLNSVELFNRINRIQSDINTMLDTSGTYRKVLLESMKRSGSLFFKSGAVEIDHRVLPTLLRLYAENTDPRFHPEFYQQITSGYHGNYEAFVNDLFEKSILTDSTRYFKLLKKSENVIQDRMRADPLTGVYRDFMRTMIMHVYSRADSMSVEVNRLYCKYLSGLAAMDPDRAFYPDANFTMRLSYGKVEGYTPADAVNYNYYSTLDGIIEKEDPDIPDYQVPGVLKASYAGRDLGPYLVDGKLPVCFIASNHTSGGNSGSPVLNAEGNLIGINFDRNWEGTVSDYAYDPDVCRNISLDIRYMLYIIDNIANADWLLNELTIIDK
jgi:hypothetical protein